MKISEVFKKAKKHLSTDFKQGICLAIQDALFHYRDSETRASLHEAVSIVQERLGMWSYAHHWLGAKVLFGNRPVVYHEDRERVYEWAHRQSEKSIQAWRHAWLDQLIEEFEGKEGLAK